MYYNDLELAYGTVPPNFKYFDDLQYPELQRVSHQVLWIGQNMVHLNNHLSTALTITITLVERSPFQDIWIRFGGVHVSFGQCASLVRTLPLKEIIQFRQNLVRRFIIMKHKLSSEMDNIGRQLLFSPPQYRPTRSNTSPTNRTHFE